MRLSWRAWLAAGALVLGTGGLLAVVVDLRAVAAQLRSAQPGYLAAASMALAAGLVLFAVRWWWLMGNGPRLGVVLQAANAGHAANILLPFRVGEAVRVALLARAGAASGGAAAASVVVERMLEQVLRLGAVGGAVVFGVGLPVSPMTVSGALVFLMAAFAAMVLLQRARPLILRRVPAAMARLPRVTEVKARAVLTHVLDGLVLAAAPGRLAVALSLTVAVWVCMWGFQALTLLALPGELALEQGLAISLGALALAPPSAPTQPGIFHASVVGPLMVVGFEETTLTAYAVLLHALMMVWMLGLGALGLAGLSTTAGKKTAAQAAQNVSAPPGRRETKGTKPGATER